MARPKKKYLESMRGIAACIVVFMHYVNTFYPGATIGNLEGDIQLFSWQFLCLSAPIGIFLAGHFAVCVFFILSGYVLSYKFMGNAYDKIAITGALVKRPFRLGGLVAFTVIAGAILWTNNLFANGQVSDITGAWWFRRSWEGDLAMPTFVRDSLLSLFSAAYKYNPPLWSIEIELYGSILVFLVLLLFGSSRYRMLICVALVILLIWVKKEVYCGFLIGMILADLRTNYSSQYRTLQNRWVPLLCLLIGLYLASYPSYTDPKVLKGTMFGWLPLIGFGRYSMMGAVMIFIAIESQPRLQSYLETGILVALGRLSYAIYAIHFLVLGSFSSWLFLSFHDHLGRGAAFLTVGGVSLIMILVLSYLLTKWVDEPAIRVSGGIGRLVVNYASNLFEKHPPSNDIGEVSPSQEAGEETGTVDTFGRALFSTRSGMDLAQGSRRSS